MYGRVGGGGRKGPARDNTQSVPPTWIHALVRPPHLMTLALPTLAVSLAVAHPLVCRISLAPLVVVIAAAEKTGMIQVIVMYLSVSASDISLQMIGYEYRKGDTNDKRGK